MWCGMGASVRVHAAVFRAHPAVLRGTARSHLGVRLRREQDSVAGPVWADACCHLTGEHSLQDKSGHSLALVSW